MNNKGFTLMELLLSIFLLSCVALGLGVGGYMLYKGAQVADAYISSATNDKPQTACEE